MFLPSLPAAADLFVIGTSLSFLLACSTSTTGEEDEEDEDEGIGVSGDA